MEKANCPVLRLSGVPFFPKIFFFFPCNEPSFFFLGASLNPFARKDLFPFFSAFDGCPLRAAHSRPPPPRLGPLLEILQNRNVWKPSPPSPPKALFPLPPRIPFSARAIVSSPSPHNLSSPPLLGISSPLISLLSQFLFFFAQMCGTPFSFFRQGSHYFPFSVWGAPPPFPFSSDPSLAWLSPPFPAQSPVFFFSLFSRRRAPSPFFFFFSFPLEKDYTFLPLRTDTFL